MSSVPANLVASAAPTADGASSEATDPTRQFATITFFRGALVAMAVTLVMGLLGALYSIPAIAPWMQSVGLDLRQLRPLHTAFAGAWIYLGGATVVHRFLQDHAGPPTMAERYRLRIQVACWALAGLGILGSLMFRVTSGREYLGFHPAFSALILIGWICYTWNFFSAVRRTFWTMPIYVTMWGVAFFFFTYTFLEQHAYLIPAVFADPVVDLRVQWKATGTLVGSFNLFVYGTLVYVMELISGDSSYGHSKTAYALFGVGLLNSFTNFGHHTYHLPQSAVVNWISFVVSMTEIIILLRAVQDVWRLVRDRTRSEYSAARTSFTAAKWWTAGMLFTSVVISIPPINAVIHGTYVVTGHAMGATIGIDTMILLGAMFWILRERLVERGVSPVVLDSARMKRILIWLNVAVASLVAWLHVSGLTTSLTRMVLAPNEPYVAPTWLGASNGIVFSLTGGLAAVCFALVLAILLPVGFGRSLGPLRRV